MTKVYILIQTEEDGPVDSATYFYQDRIIGVYDSPEAADGARAKLGEWHLSRASSGYDETMRNARIEEHDVLTQAQPWLAAL